MSCSYIISYDYGYYLVSAVHVLVDGLVSAAVSAAMVYDAAAGQDLVYGDEGVQVYAADVEVVCDNAVEVAAEALVDSDNNHICNRLPCVQELCPRTGQNTSCT